MAIEQIPIRASISSGSFSVVTPYILNFSVNKQRGTYTTFSASLKVLGEDVDKLTDQVVIYAGVKGSLNKLFTGFIKKRRTTPCWDDPAYLILNIEGADVLTKLEFKKFNRRQIVSNTSWTLINSVTPGLKSGTLKFTKDPVLVATSGNINAADGSTFTGNDDTKAIRNDKVLGDNKKSDAKQETPKIIEITRE